MDFAPGTVVAGLRFERILGRGAYGTVYFGRNELIGRRVAIKVIEADPETDVSEHDRALREARAVGRLNSNNIVTLYAVHPADEEHGWIFELEYVPGGSLGDVLEREQRLAPDRVVAVARDVLSALGASHAAGIVHGDIKPGNVLLGARGTAKLADFGLARMVGDLALSISTADEAPAGTPGFMAPEVVMGHAPEMASDLWSVGVLLYRALTGVMPFSGSTFNEFFFAVMNAEPAPLGPEIPGNLRGLLDRLLAKKADERPASAEAAAAMLDAAPDPEVATRPAVTAPALYGREPEGLRLAGLLREVERGRGVAVLITGAGGIGKSALVHAFAPQAVERGCRFIEANATAVEGLFRTLVRAVHFQLDEEGVDRIDKLLAAMPSEISADLMRNILEEKSDANLATRQQIAWAAEQLLIQLAKELPLALLIEDVHRVDPEDLKLLRELARRLPAHRIMLVITYGTRVAESSATDIAGYRDLVTLPGLQHIDLDPLSREAIYRILEARTEAVRLAPAVSQRILDLSEGNPLFASEMLKHMEEAGAVQLDGSLLRAGPKWQAVALPGRFHDLVAVRVAELPEDLRAVLDVAAVDGRVFDAEALTAVLERPLLSVLRDLQRLYREYALVEPHEDGFHFTSTLVQEVIYRELAPALRRAFHERIAQHLDARAEPPDPERHGLHWERAGNKERARPFLLEATRSAAVRQEYGRALRLARRVGLVPGSIDKETAYAEATTLLKLADVLYGRGNYQEMGELYHLLREAAIEHDDPELQDRCEVNRALAGYFTKGAAGVDRERIEKVTTTLPVSRELGYAYHLLGLIARYRGDLETARSRLEQADRVFVEIEHHAGHSATLNTLAAVARREGDYEEAQERFHESAQISEAIGRRTNAAVSQINSDMVRFSRADFAGLEASVEKSVRTLQVEGAEAQAGHAAVFLAELRFALADLAGATRAMHIALELLRDHAYLPAIAGAKLQEAQVAAVRGQLDTARECIDAARAAAGKSENSAALLQAALEQTQLACYSADDELAAHHAAEALALVADMSDEALRRQVVYWLAEATLHGLSSDVLPPESPCESLAAVWRAADRRAMPDVLAAGAALLIDGGDGTRHATLQIVGERFAAEAARRRGRRREAAEAAQRAMLAARAFGHAWHELGALRFLLQLAPDDEHTARATMLVRTIRDALASPEERERVTARWKLD